MFTHRLQDNSRWPNPIVLKITNVKPAFTPPKLETKERQIRRRHQDRIAHRNASGSGKGASLEVGFEFRSIVGLDASDRSIPWQQGPSTTLSRSG